MTEETGVDLDKVNQDTERDYWLDAQEAVDYGLVGKIITNRSEITTD